MSSDESPNRSQPQILRHVVLKIWNGTVLALATGLGTGLAPAAPGTVGSLLGPPLVWWLRHQQWPVAVYAVVTVAIALIGVPICSKAARLCGRSDPAQVVYDEIAAFPVVFCLVPVDLLSGTLGFLWFRLFDITKPWPVHRFERLPQGLGIMADDLIAAVYAAAALWLSIRTLSFL